MYSVNADTRKNRLTITLNGTIEETEVKQYNSDVKKQVSLLRPGFTSLLDLREAHIFTQSMVGLDTFTETKEIAVKAGLSKSAMVVNSPTLKMQISRIFKEVGTKDEAFQTIEDAEKFLDEK